MSFALYAAWRRAELARQAPGTDAALTALASMTPDGEPKTT